MAITTCDHTSIEGRLRGQRDCPGLFGLGSCIKHTFNPYLTNQGDPGMGGATRRIPRGEDGPATRSGARSWSLQNGDQDGPVAVASDLRGCRQETSRLYSSNGGSRRPVSPEPGSHPADAGRLAIRVAAHRGPSAVVRRCRWRAPPHPSGPCLVQRSGRTRGPRSTAPGAGGPPGR